MPSPIQEFDEIEEFDEPSPTNDLSAFGEYPSSPLEGSTPETIDARPTARFNLLNQMGAEKGRLEGIGESAESLANSASPMGALGVAGNVVKGGIADIAPLMSVFKRPEGVEAPLLPSPSLIGETVKKNLPFAISQTGNTPAALSMEPLPVDTMLDDISAEAPGAATLGKISMGVAGSLPLLAIMPQGALGKLVAAGFTADMLSHAGPDATALGEEMGKPPEERDNAKITSALSSLIQTAAFAPATAVHAGAEPLSAAGRFAMEKAAPNRAAINELAKSLQQEPMSRPKPLTPNRRLGIPVPEGEFAQPGARELADAALTEAQSPIVRPGQPALEALRNEINPPRIGLEEPTRLAERVSGGGEAPYGKVSYQREALPFFDRASEAEGLGRQSTAPTLEDIRAARAAEGRQNAISIRETAPLPLDARTEAGGKVEPQVREQAAAIESPRSNAGGSEVQAPKEVGGLKSIEDVPAKDWNNFVKGKGVKNQTDFSYRFAEENPDVTAENFFEAKKKRTAEGKVSGFPDQGLKGQFFEEAGRWRQALDSAANLKNPTLEELAQVERDFGVGDAVSSGKELQASLERTKSQKPLNEGGSQENLSPEKKAISVQNNSIKAFADASGVPYVEGDTPATIFAKIQAKSSSPKPSEAVAPEPSLEAPASAGTEEISRIQSEIERATAEREKILGQYPKATTKSEAWLEGDPFLEGQVKFDSKWQDSITDINTKISNLQENLRIQTEASDWASKAINGIENLQAKIQKGFLRGDAALGVPAAILDTALQSAKLALKAGKSVAEAIEAALLHIRKNVKAFNEKAVRSLFEKELGGKTIPPPSAKVSGNAGSGVVSKPTSSSLNDLYKIFEPKKTQGPSLKQRGVNFIESLRTGFSSKFRPLNKLAEDIAKAYGITKPKDIAALAEQLKGSQGKAESEIYRFDKDVSDLVKGNEKDFNVYMFIRRSLDRLNQDSKDIGRALAGEDVPTLNRRRVAGHTINNLTERLQELESKLGPDVTAKFGKAADAYQKYMDDSLQLQVKSGRMSPEVYDAIKEGNQFYAPFKVAKYFEQQMKPSGVGKSIDTQAQYTQAMKGIEDADFKLGDMQAAARQNILISRILADKNNVMQKFSDLAAQDVNKQFIRRLGPNESPANGKEFITVREAGKPVRYEVDPQIASTIKSLDSTSQGVVLDYLGKGAIPFRAGATTLNVPFQAVNLIAADLPRQALVSKYGIHGVSDLIRYPMGFIESAFSAIAGNNFGFKNKLYLDYLESGTAGNTLQESLTPEALKFKEPTTISKSAKLGRTVIYSLADFAKAIEETNKIHGVKRAMREEGVKSGKELSPEAVTEIRRFSGSPDFGRVGGITEQAGLNVFQPFFNARLQGAIADVGRLTGRDGAKTAAATWGRLGAVVGSAALYAYMLNNREENREDYAKRPVQEKQNYFLIPKSDADGKPRYVTMEDGSKVRDYWRIPKREAVKWFANSLESALDFARDKDPKALAAFGGHMVQEVTPVNIQGDSAPEKLESVVSGLNPLIKGPIEVATGRDTYRHRDLIPDTMKNASPENQYKETTPEFFKGIAAKVPGFAPEFLRSPLMLENVTRNLTAGLITQFLPRKQLEGRSGLENNPLTQRFQSLPYTDNEKFKGDMDELKREAADAYLDRHRKALELVKQVNPRDGLSAIKFQGPVDPKLVRHVVDLYMAKQNGANSEDFQIQALPAQQRADYVIRQLNRQKTDAAREQLMQTFARKRIVTKAVLEAMAEAQ